MHPAGIAHRATLRSCCAAVQCGSSRAARWTTRPNGQLPPVRQVAKLVATLGARGHETFGGRLQPDAKGFPASAMAKKVSGDWRDPDHVGEFAAVVARSLGVPIA